jgi:CPA1 family monovalent cation:H+ antiporter
VLQGFTLRPPLLKPYLEDEDPMGGEVAQARSAAHQAALASLEGDQARLAEALRVELKGVLMRANGSAEALTQLQLATSCDCVL